ncbi:PH and SEC7 domain-containing protein 3 [Carlito syrichta]|uniref:PH and SEC7 domain-containing protein 3 n=1 Tax=Carlito syrichta TaxID=1868482 RepID=A0A3Q0DIF0_CARSF|nr:PH and SEC7 domain-containing protein 3 [Carlito syrichta]
MSLLVAAVLSQPLILFILQVLGPQRAFPELGHLLWEPLDVVPLLPARGCPNMSKLPFALYWAETFVWVNNASAHSQNVAKAKYEFLFGRPEEKTPDTSDHGGSTLLPPNVTNEFPEYGTMEEGGEGLRTSLEFDGESLPCHSQGQQGVQLSTGHYSGLDSVTEGPKDVREAPSQSHLKEPSLQPIDSLISALKATEARIASGTLQAAKVLDKDVVSSFSLQQVEKELGIASCKTQRANKPLPAGQEKPPGIPLSAEVTTEENLYLSIQKDLTALLSGDTQAQLPQRNGEKGDDGRKGALCLREPDCPVSSLGSPAVTHNSVSSTGFLKEQRSALGREYPVGCDRGSSLGRTGRIKHVEFQGVEILWTGRERREHKTQHTVGFETSLERTASTESKEFSKVPSHLMSSAGLCNSINLTESVWDGSWKTPSERPGTSSGAYSPVRLDESGEDEVFLKENKQHLDKKPEPEREKER